MSIEEIKLEFSKCFIKEKHTEAAFMIDEVVRNYSEAHRSYHNLNHVIFILENLSSIPLEKEKKELLFLVTLFHDFIYEVGSKSNELESAEFAREYLNRLDYDKNKIAWVSNCILLTKHHDCFAADELQKIFCDLDLLIFASTSLVYQKYTQQIREEYMVYPNFLYNAGRKKLLKMFLKRDKIFQSNYYQHLEEQARLNINQELKQL